MMNSNKAFYVLVVVAIASAVGYALLSKPRVASPLSSEPEIVIRNSKSEATLPRSGVTSRTTRSSIEESAQSVSQIHASKFQDQFPDPTDHLRRLGLDSTESGIRKTLADTSNNSAARYWSAMALGKSKGADAGQILAEVLENDRILDVRIGAIGGLAYLGDSGSISVLENYLNHDPNEILRESIVSALYRNNSDAGREVLRRTASDQSQVFAVRRQSLAVLSQTRTPDMANTMRVFLVDEQPELRAIAAIALSHEHGDEVISHLVNAALDENVPLSTWGNVIYRLQAITGDRFTKVKSIEYVTNSDARLATKREIEVWWDGVTASHR